MNPTQRQTPFDELRALVRELRNRCTSEVKPGSDKMESSSTLFARIDEWIALAEQRRERSESIIASARDAFIAMNAEGQIIEWNQEAERIFGWSSEEAIGRSVVETVIPPEQRSGHKTGLQRFLETGEGPVLNQRIEVPALRRDGTEFPAELTVLEPQRIGESFVFNAFVRDITRRREAVEAIRGSEALYHSLVDRLPINVTRKDLEGRITFVNRPFCELVGMTSDELVGKTDYDLSPRELADKYRRDDQYAATTGNVFHTIEENRADDRVIYFEVWKVPVRDAAGEVVETQAVFWDVTEREENRSALARERDLLRTLMDSLPDLIYVKDTNGRFVMVNRGLLELWGNPPAESIAGKTVFDFAPEDLAAEYASEDREVLESGQAIVDREEQVVGPGGDRLIYSTTKVPLHNPDGRVSGLVGIDRDITNRKRTEKELRQAQQAADAANQAKSDFLANMSHEIRTPLNAVIGITDLLLAGDAEQGQREYLEIVRESGESLMVVINDILDFSKIEAGQLQLESTVFNLPEAIGGAMKALALRAHVKGIELGCDIEYPVPELVHGDPVRLRQIITNLVGNAIKFTDEGEVVLTVRSERHEDQVGLCFRIRDTGIGIPADKLEHIFDAFAQADATTTRRFGGTGLGLAISSRLVEAMGGKLKANSEVGVGSEFQFDVSLRKASDADVEVQPLNLDSMTGKNVLVVDDNATNRRILVDMVRSLSMNAFEAPGAYKAMEHLAVAHQTNSPIAIVLTDINMPEVDGFMLSERIREEQSWSQPVIIALTSGPRPNEESLVRRLGVAAQLLKPIKRSELYRAILDAASPTVPVSDPGERANPVMAGSLSILLAEDSRANQILTVGILERESHSVTVASNGREAIEQFKAGKFDLILMDVQMPEMDGFQATAVIRAHERESGSHIPVLAMTAHAMSGDRERCLEAGMDGYLSKPIRLNEFVRSIREIARSSAESGREDS